MIIAFGSSSLNYNILGALIFKEKTLKRLVTKAEGDDHMIRSISSMNTYYKLSGLTPFVGCIINISCLVSL